MNAKQNYHHGALQKSLIDVAWTYMSETGSSVIPMAEICRRAGVSTAAPYRHFVDQADFLHALSGRGFLELLWSLKRAKAFHPDDEQALIVGLGKEYVRFAVENPGPFRLMFTKSDGPSAENSDTCYSVLLDTTKLYCQKTKTNQNRSEEVSMQLWAFVHGVSCLLIDGNSAFDPIAADIDLFIEEGIRGIIAGLH